MKGSSGSLVKKWYRAFRPITLGASVIPVLVGTSLVLKEGEIKVTLFLLTLAGSVLIQIGTNLADECSDYTRGSYKSKFPAPHRVIHQGLLPLQSVRLATYLCFVIVSFIGLYLTWVAGWLILLIGVASIAAAYFYSAGPLPLGNLGLGEPLVFFFMGIVAVVATYYIQTGEISRDALVVSLSIAFLVTAILEANNLRDEQEDKEAGKNTTATLFGRRVAIMIYSFLVSGAFLVVIGMVVWGNSSLFLLAPLLSLPWGLSLILQIWCKRKRSDFNETIKGTALFHLQFGLLLAAGLWASHLLNI